MTLKKLVKNGAVIDASVVYDGYIVGYITGGKYENNLSFAYYSNYRVKSIVGSPFDYPILRVYLKPPKQKKAKRKYKLYRNTESGHFFVQDEDSFQHEAKNKFDTVEMLENLLDPDVVESNFKEEYRKFMKKYVKEHLDEIGLHDGEDAMD